MESYASLVQEIRRILIEDRHSVRFQVQHGLDLHLAWLAVQACRRDPQSGATDSTFGHLIDVGWLYTQGSLLRSVALDVSGPDVCSLKHAIKLVKENRSLVTRRAFVELGGIDYQYEDDQQRYYLMQIQMAERRRMDGRPFIATPVTGTWWQSQRRHDQFDWVSGVAPGQRKEDDLPQIEWLGRLESRMEAACLIVDNYATSHLAHKLNESSVNSNPRFRSFVGEGSGLRPQDVEDGWRAVIQVGRELASLFCQFGIEPDLHVHYTAFNSLTRPWITPANLPELRNEIAQHRSRMEKWWSINPERADTLLPLTRQCADASTTRQGAQDLPT